MKHHNFLSSTIITIALIFVVIGSLIISGASTAKDASASEQVTLNTSGTASSVEASPEMESLQEISEQVESVVDALPDDTTDSSDSISADASYTEIITSITTATNGTINGEEEFTTRDLTQSVDYSDAEYYTVSDGDEIHITTAGVYVLSGTAASAVIYVEADSEADKVQLVLDGLNITNNSFPCIYVISADKVFITTVSESTLKVTGSFVSDGDTNTDGVIFSKEDLVLNGTSVLNIESTENAVVSKDSLKVTGGTYNITAGNKGFEANDSISIAAGTFSITVDNDGISAGDDDDNTIGYVYICGGDFTISASDKGINAVTICQIDGGSFNISAAEGIQATYIEFNGGSFAINSWDDGINASYNTSLYSPSIVFNGGDFTIVMGSGDTDAVDSNGSITVNGGTINITGQSSFDYDISGVLNGGTVIINGEQYTYLPSSMGGMGGGRGGMGGRGGF